MAKNFLSGLFGGKSSKAAEPKPEGDIPAEETAPPIEAVEVASEDETSLPISAPDADEPTTPTVESAPEKKKGFFSRLREGLSRSSNRLAEGVASIFTKKKLDEETIEELEELLISADLGVSAARAAAALSKDRFDKEISPAEVRTALAGEVAAILTPFEKQLVIDPAHSPFVILMTGVNGAGKTTTIGKLAAKFAREGRKVMLAAGDTFRAAAIEQLMVWGDRTGAPVVAKSVGADAAGLAYEAFQRAREEGADVLLIDTAGRLQNRRELMDELAKIVRVLKKLDETAPHATLLVLDATVGQNALSQAQVFTEIAGVDGLVMTKLDGTARGGVLVAVSEKTKLPIHYIGVGESVDDLQPFDATRFARALAGLDDEGKND
ncbi:MAG: signal recognition particle-docking protein FtsY [Parvularculaceae bacterium]